MKKTFFFYGYFTGSLAGGQGNVGTFWSSTRLDDYSMYSLHLDDSSVYPSLIGSRDYGYSVRCVLGS